VFLLITGTKTIKLLIIFWGPIAYFSLVSSDCVVGILKLNDFDWTKLGIMVLTCLVYTAAVKTAAGYYISFVVPLAKCLL